MDERDLLARLADVCECGHDERAHSLEVARSDEEVTAVDRAVRTTVTVERQRRGACTQCDCARYRRRVRA